MGTTSDALEVASVASVARVVSSGTVRVDERCTACGNCLITCPTTALRPAPGRPTVIDARCTSCGACVEVCPVDAITETITEPVAGVEIP
ncbi:MAG: 4Fe-4S binding protein [Actinomycetota bacterium]